MRKKIDIELWARKDHFQFFDSFEEPFFGVTVEVDCTRAYQTAKSQGTSFFIYYLFASLQAANQIDAFRYRIENGEVYLYDEIHASATIPRPNDTFGFSYMNYHASYSDFEKVAQQEITRVANSTDLDPSGSGENVIHYSSLPWIKFTALSHARSYSFRNSCPKISFGKVVKTDNKRTMPVSIHVHHGLVDGSHVGQYVALFQEIMNR